MLHIVVSATVGAWTVIVSTSPSLLQPEDVPISAVGECVNVDNSAGILIITSFYLHTAQKHSYEQSRRYVNNTPINYSATDFLITNC